MHIIVEKYEDKDTVISDNNSLIQRILKNKGIDVGFKERRD
jgi:hypothetical protein